MQNHSGGYIKLHRQLLGWEWYDDANTMRVFLHILLNANWETSKYHGETINEGDYLTTLPEIAGQLKLSVQNVRTAIDHLELTGEVTVKKKPKYRIVTVKKWSLYQQTNSQTNSQLTGNQQSTNSQLTGNVSLYTEEKKEEEERKKCEGGFAAAAHAPTSSESQKTFFEDTPTLADIQSYIYTSSYTYSPERFYNYYAAQDWKRHGQRITNWKVLADEWQRRESAEKRQGQGGNSGSVQPTQSSFNLDELSDLGILYDLGGGG